MYYLRGHIPLFSDVRIPSFFDKIKERILIKKQNVNIAFTGENRSGKSYSALKFANIFSKEILNKKPLLCFTYEKFFEYAENDNIYNDVIVFDEVGSESRVERWYEVESQNLAEILELWGMKKCIVLFTLPNWSRLTTAVKGMIHFRCHCFLDVVEKKVVYKTNVMRKIEKWKTGKEIFFPFKTLIIEKDNETDELYEKYYFTEKVKNYKEKLQEMKNRYNRAHRVIFQTIPTEFKTSF